MRKCMIAYVVYSKIERGFDNYERNTRGRHLNATPNGRKRDVGNEDLKDDSEQLWQGRLSKFLVSSLF
jgi:hypothetical protein